PIHEQYLVLEGRLSESSLSLVRKGLPGAWGGTSIPLFFSCANADLSLGKELTRLFPYHRPADAIEMSAKVIAVTQQFAKPYHEIPHGWNTVTLFEFAQGIPDAIKSLRQVDGWHSLPPEERLCLANDKALKAIK